MKNIILKSQFTVPIYNRTVLVIVAVDAIKAFNRYAKRFEEKREKPNGFAAMCVSNSAGEVGVFFHTDLICESDIGHELKHVEDFILTNIGETSKAGECRAYLNGYLHHRVKNILRKRKVKLRTK